VPSLLIAAKDAAAQVPHPVCGIGVAAQRPSHSRAKPLK
jgi:hypothetical protein